MKIREYVDHKISQGSLWHLDTNEMDARYPKVMMSRDQWRVYQNHVDLRAFIDSLGIQYGTWCRSLQHVWFDSEDDAVLFKLSLP